MGIFHSRRQLKLSLGVCALLSVIPCAVTFMNSWSGDRKHRSWCRGRSRLGGNYGGFPPRRVNHQGYDQDDSKTPLSAQLMGHYKNVSYDGVSWPSKLPRGGDTSTSPVANVVKGTRASLASTASYWSRGLESARQAVTTPIRLLNKMTKSLFQSSSEKRQAQLLKQLETLPVQHVIIANNSTVLPKEVIQAAAVRSGLLGNPLRTDRVQQFAQSLKSWYTRNGFVLHGVTGATLNIDTATAEIAVNEPHCTAPNPVNIKFCKEMVIDQESGALMTLRQYKNHHIQRRTIGFGSTGNRLAGALSKDQLNMTMVKTVGRTSPSRIASALGLHALRPFQWDSIRWNRVLESGIFSRVFHATPTQLPDGSVQLQILVTEAPARHLEYGVGRSIYSGSWEGALDFEHINLLGGGERLGLSVRRGTKDAEPSARLSYSDSRFGQPGGYDCEVFSEYVGEKANESNATANKDVNDKDATLDRKGATFRVHDKLLLRSTASISLEQTVTNSGRSENIGSSSLSVGPFMKEFPSNARANIDSLLTIGTRIMHNEDSNRPIRHIDLLSKTILPFWTFTATTRQILPLRIDRVTQKVVGTITRPLLLAFRQSVTASSRHIPRHLAKAQGISNSVRGSHSHEELSSAVQVTAELRIPVSLLDQQRQPKDTSIILFGDFLCACRETAGPYATKSSIGIGARATIAGFPLKLDICWLPDEDADQRYKFKPHFGVGGDFSV